jgi:hypothetical protein
MLCNYRKCFDKQNIMYVGNAFENLILWANDYDVICWNTHEWLWYHMLEYTYLYYWFSVGEGTLPLHHLIAQNTPNKKTEMQN